MPTQRSGAQIIWEFLVHEGVNTVFGYPGGAILPAYDAMLDYPVRHVLVRHEQGASHMADGFARAGGGVGVCVATSGPGATNLVTGIATAQMDSSPIVCITGQVPCLSISPRMRSRPCSTGPGIQARRSCGAIDRILRLRSPNWRMPLT